ncbi:nicotinate (nicotinamide) nucleotide adenylyltransferase [Clostridium mediterraneense]|uniref:nicotinate (nicotinamide) nucleotide adenylyltransferase n=1 Tax=Clostridium mediterraneense TaxID=1805472 RepID=UPI00083449AF|nr:nicotinate (nicotinamide) nucleotide adenylyltransferase [Clostridium mediterraneense]
MNKDIIAIYGGSFNPPTIAHENIARDILSLSDINKLIYLPVGDAYKKKNLIESNYRYEMLKIISNKLVLEDFNIEISTLEMDTDRRLYTIESLRILKEKYKKDLAFVMGTDNIKEFNSWSNPKSLLEEFYFIVIEREEDDVSKLIKENHLLNKYQDKFLILKDTSYKSVSSTYIRENIGNIELVQSYIDKEVLSYIKKNNLYGGMVK